MLGNRQCRRRCQPGAGTPVADEAVGDTLAPELCAQDRQQIGVDEHRRRDERASLLHLVDDSLPRLRQLEIGGSLGGEVRHNGLDHAVDTASVVDPFRNILGIMCNPHYLEVLAATTTA